NRTEFQQSHVDGSTGPFKHVVVAGPNPYLSNYKGDQSAIVRLSHTPAVPVIFFEGDGSLLTNSDGAFMHGGKLTRGPDERLGDVDCFVLTNEIPRAHPGDDYVIGITWVGKDDHLIHQLRQLQMPDPSEHNWGGLSVATKTEVHENILINEPMTREDFLVEVPPGTVFTNFELPKDPR
ncbi:MAG TPA: hypothetical protein VFC07_09770, partial [Verrucomicrobiae bacterium]|nr:hypothetical protein [Verrucomicrobiae bacterium]